MPTPKPRETPNRTAPSPRIASCSKCRHITSSVGMRSAYDDASNHACRDECRPAHFAVETLRFAFTRSVPNCGRNCWSHYKETENHKDKFHPYRLHVGENNRVVRMVSRSWRPSA